MKSLEKRRIERLVNELDGALKRSGLDREKIQEWGLSSFIQAYAALWAWIKGLRAGLPENVVEKLKLGLQVLAEHAEKGEIDSELLRLVEDIISELEGTSAEKG